MEHLQFLHECKKKKTNQNHLPLSRMPSGPFPRVCESQGAGNFLFTFKDSSLSTAIILAPNGRYLQPDSTSGRLLASGPTASQLNPSQAATWQSAAAFTVSIVRLTWAEAVGVSHWEGKRVWGWGWGGKRVGMNGKGSEWLMHEMLLHR